MRTFHSTCRIRQIIFLCIVGMFFGVYGSVYADAPSRNIGFQGQLYTGATPVNASVNATFRFYDALSGGNAQGGLISKTVSVTNGYFGVSFSEADMTGINPAQSLWIEVTINGDTLSPRSSVNSIPLSNNTLGVLAYASAPAVGPSGSLYYSTTTAQLFVSDGSVWSAVQGPWSTSGSDIYFTGGKVGIGTTTPTDMLEVIGNITSHGVLTSVGTSGSAAQLALIDDVNGYGGIDIQTYGGGVTGSPHSYVNLIGSRGNQNSVSNLLSGDDLGMLNFYGQTDSGLELGAAIGAVAASNFSGSSVPTDLFFITSKSERMRIDANGNVGIGTTTPSAKLSIQGDAYIAGNLTATGTGVFATGLTLDGVLGNATLNFRPGYENFAGYGVTVGTYDHSIDGYKDGLKMHAYDGISFWTNNSVSERVRITQTGNVGIGTTSPSAKLAITGSGTGTGRAFTIADSANAEKFTVLDNGQVNITNTVNMGSNILRFGNLGSISFHFTDGTALYGAAENTLAIKNAGTETVRFTHNNLVGIGTTTPSAKLAITGTAGTGDVFAVASSTNTNMFVVKSTGNVGIGTTNPSSNFQIGESGGPNFTVQTSGLDRANLKGNYGGDNRYQLTTDAVSEFGGLANNNRVGALRLGANAVYSYILGGVNNSSDLSINPSGGNVGIGTTTPSAKLSVQGNALIIGTTTVSALYSTGSATVDGTVIANAFMGDGSGIIGLNASNVSNGILGIAYGGTGTSTAPAAGELLMGDGLGGYSLVATSSLGIPASQWTTSASNIYYTNGNVGIGTTTPADKLSVIGSGHFTTGLSVGGATATTTGTRTVITTNSLLAYSGTEATARLRMGIAGVTNGIPGLVFDSTLGGLGATGGGIGQEAAQTLSFYTGNGSALTERVRISPLGYFGIGTTTPSAKLAVTGTSGSADNVFVVASSTNAALVTISGTRPTTNTTGVLTVYDNDAAKSSDGAIISIHADDSSPFLGKFYNHTYSTSNPVMTYYADNSGNFTQDGPVSLKLTRGSNTSVLLEAAGTTISQTTGSTALLVDTTGSKRMIIKGGSTAPTSLGSSYYLGLGNTEYAANSYRLIGLGYSGGGVSSYPAYIGYQEISSSGNTYGDLVFGTRSVTTDTSATERLRITSAGNIGIGTTSPTAKLAITSSGTGTGSAFVVANSSNAEMFKVLDNGTVSIPAGARLTSIADTTTGLYVGSDRIRFDYQNSEKWRVDFAGRMFLSQMTLTSTANFAGSGIWNANGEVGIGTTTPSAKLAITGTAGTGDVFAVASSTNASMFVVKSTGNVGIGTSDPQLTLDVVGSLRVSDGFSRFFDVVGNGITYSNDVGTFFSVSDTTVDIGDGYPNAMDLRINSSTYGYALYARSGNGRLGVRVDPLQTFHVQGTSRFSSDASNYMEMSIGSTGLTTYDATGAGAAHSFSDNVGIGTTTPNQRLVVVGTARITNLLGGATTLSTDVNGNIIRTPSDQNLKEQVLPIEDALTKVSNLQGVSFFWKDKTRFGEQKEIGLIAQEVEKVIPEVVQQGSEYKSVNYPNLVALLIEAVKELHTKVNSVVAWFANNKFNVQGDICVDEVCVTKEQFKQMLLQQGSYVQQVPTPQPPSEPSSQPASTDEDVKSDASETGTEDAVSEGESAPSEEPVIVEPEVVEPTVELVL